MAGEVELLVVVWKGWGIQVMVLLSFTVQVTLLLLADIRRQKDSTLLKFIIWSAYMLADTTAIYALGHMSLVSRSPEQQLIALWAPLLLVHLGGQDNITAYAIEDNRLWLRHGWRPDGARSGCPGWKTHTTHRQLQGLAVRKSAGDAATTGCPRWRRR